MVAHGQPLPLFSLPAGAVPKSSAEGGLCRGYMRGEEEILALDSTLWRTSRDEAVPGTQNRTTKSGKCTQTDTHWLRRPSTSVIPRRLPCCRCRRKRGTEPAIWPMTLVRDSGLGHERRRQGSARLEKDKGEAPGLASRQKTKPTSRLPTMVSLKVAGAVPSSVLGD